MDLASGYSDQFNYGNGYTPLANNAINNNNFNYNANQAYANQVGQYDPFAQSGGFGAMTDYYSSLGAAFGRNTGGFNAGNSIPGGYPSGTVQRGPDLPDLSLGGNEDIQWMLGGSKGPRPSTVPGWGGQADQDWVKGGSQGDRPSTRPDFDTTFKDAFANQQKAIDTWPQNWDKYFGDVTKGAPQPQWQPNEPFQQQPVPQTTINNPSMQQLLGYTPGNTFGGAEDTQWMKGGSQGPRPSSVQGWGGQADQDWVKGGSQGQRPSTRDDLARTMSGAPANGPYPNLGYNPAMQNYFANPTMKQYDWTANNDQLQKQMQDALKTIDGATGNQPAQPYGGALPPFWQGARDFFGAGPAQPTPQQPYQPWNNAS